MKKAALVCLVMVSIFGFLAYAMSSGPLGVSPGAGSGETVVGSPFPTFSWSAVERAVGYRLEVFKTIEDAAGHEEIAQTGELVMRVDIPAPALSWSPSGSEALQAGESYIWYVKAFDPDGEGQWSIGNRFRIDASVALTGMEDAVKEKVREYVRTDTELRNTIREIKEEACTQGSLETVAVGTGESPEGGRLKGTEGDSTTSYGKDAGATGTANTFIGRSAGNANSSGSINTFVGHEAGKSNTTGPENTFVGAYAGAQNTTGENNTFVGRSAGSANSGASMNTFVGASSGQMNTHSNNTFVGALAGNENTTGFSNAFLGAYAGRHNSNGYFNTFVGRAAGGSNIGGNHNTFIGNSAGEANISGDYNTFLGESAGSKTTSASHNTFIGRSAGSSNIDGARNTFIGQESGFSTTSGAYNTFLGYRAGFSNTNGSQNIFLGYESGLNETGSSKLYIHNSNSSSPLIYGDFSARQLKLNGALTIIDLSASSDISLKKDVQALEGSLDKIASLKGVSYNWRTEEYPDRGFTENRQIGLIAQDVEKVLPELVRTDKDGKKSLAYDKLTAVLVEALKAQQAEIKEQESRLSAQNAEMENQKARLSAQQSEMEAHKAMLAATKAEIEELRGLVRQISSRNL